MKMNVPQVQIKLDMYIYIYSQVQKKTNARIINPWLDRLWSMEDRCTWNPVSDLTFVTVNDCIYIHIYIFAGLYLYIYGCSAVALSAWRGMTVWGGTKQRCAYKDSPLRHQYKFAYLLHICICVCLSLWIAVIPTISNCPQNSFVIFSNVHHK